MFGVLALQARGEDFTIQQAARILRSLWPRICFRLDHFGPEDLSKILRVYWWQLLYSRQELALAGVTREHPILELIPSAAENQSNRNRAVGKDQESLEELKARLVRPVLSRVQRLGPGRQTVILRLSHPRT